MADAQAMTIPKQAIDAAAKAIADSIGHGMSEKCFDRARAALTAAAPYMSSSAREQALEEAAQWYEKQRQKWLEMNIGLPDFAPEIRALKSQPAPQTGGGE
ncbi:hypothetical protein ACFOLL_04565 [Falsochrobactrum ovis]|uniref:Uncharacterized protein n=1 Tax=Falsochrobactrum ovis TaxID=1293442 RepID=A0A364JVG8_9HYPH|nr:hypothetical protein [Falsochrobactrum ovis]RAK29110.1 hypothetical protein C7374_105161 [Falsochrobactrum ovis]